ncbi:MAG TPA: extracellular solute-binding protein, partial [Actinomycetota bacterium]|nr:extracellular solute-binding protein [Actinomycetota bacterium]
MKRLLSALAVLGLLAGACTAGGGNEAPATVNPSESHEPVTITIWGAWTGRELRQFNAIFKDFTATYPWITVKSEGGIGDQKIIQAINSGTAPDAVLSFGLDNVGKFCQTGAWQDLTPYIQQSNFDTSQFPPSVFQYTSYQGKQCALPFLTDAYGLYYNKDLFQGPGSRSRRRPRRSLWPTPR